MSLGLGLTPWQGARGGVDSGAAYVADAVHFDGSTYLSIASLTCTDSPNFSFSFWFRVSPDAMASVEPWASDVAGNYISYCQLTGSSPDNWGWDTILSNADGSRSLSAAVDNGGIVDDVWVNLLGSFDTNHAAGQKIAKLYLNDVDLTGTVNDANAAFNVVLNALSFFFGSDGGTGFLGDFADVWIAPGQSLLTAGAIPEATRRKFIDAGGKPVDLGAAGATPTGVAPAIFFSGDATGFATNKGTGGAFTLTGSLTNASTSPSD